MKIREALVQYLQYLQYLQNEIKLFIFHDINNIKTTIAKQKNKEYSASTCMMYCHFTSQQNSILTQTL